MTAPGQLQACRSCGAPVLFSRNINTTRRQIIDAEPHPNGNVRVDPNNPARCTVLAGQALDTARARGLVLHHDHHATCPDADQWRRRT